MLTACPEFSNQIEIVVSDNASTDETQQIAESFNNKFATICPYNYVKNPSNIGAVLNFFQAPSICVGAYLWILGDDDILMPSNFADCFRSIAVNRPDFVFCSTVQESVGCSGLSPLRELFYSFPITSLAHISRIIYRRSVWIETKDKVDATPSYYVWPLVLPLVHLPASATALKFDLPIVFTTKDGGLEIWKHKTALARLAEFSDYCKLLSTNEDELSQLFRVNFPSGAFVAKKYLAASLIFPHEERAFQNLSELLNEFRLKNHPSIVLAKFLRSSFGSAARVLIRRVLKIT
jgi:glycosyltransferase involved in cell wall biosynthesis